MKKSEAKDVDPFLAHLKKSRQTVESWPVWKKAAIGFQSSSPTTEAIGFEAAPSKKK